MSVPVADQQASLFMKEFTATGSVRISYDGSEIANLVLAGADEAIASMLDCQATMSHAMDKEKSKSDPFAPHEGKI